MDIHNLMEDIVLDTVNELFDAKVQGASSVWCTCRQCRMDVACFVLNRLKPEYVLSGRGGAYSEIDYARYSTCGRSWAACSTVSPSSQ